MPRNAREFKGTFLVKKCQNIDFFLKMIFYPDNNFQLIFMMLQIFLNLAENVFFYAIFKKVKFLKKYQFF